MKLIFKDRFSRQGLNLVTSYEVRIRYGQIGKSTDDVRENLPSIFWLDGDIWWVNSYRRNHCLTGPARTNIHGHMGYWLNGRLVTALEVLMS